MANFSNRNGYKKILNLEESSKILINKIFSYFYKEEYDYYDTLDYSNYTTGIEDMMSKMGLTYLFPKNTIFKDKNVNKLEDYLINGEWHLIYDFIEKYIEYLSNDENKQRNVIREFNKILEEESNVYRISNKIVVPITNELEIDAIEKSLNTKYESVNTHLNKSLFLYSDRKNPDYENSIKESISAVEALCCIITGEKASLGKTIKKLKDNGVHIHSAMEAAFSNLYGYTSDENGIRHGGINFRCASSEDAKYMLVSCSAFINYLIEKNIKTNL